MEAGRLPATRRTLRREDLLRAVTDHIREHGLHGFTLRKAAAAAGTTHKVLLYHFGSAPRLVAEAIDLISTETRTAGLDAATRLGPELAETLSLVWEAWKAQPWVLGEALGLAMAHPDDYGPVANRNTHEMLHVMRDVLEQRHGVDRAELLATVLVAVARGLYIDRTTTGDVERVDAAFAMLVELVTATVRGSADGPVKD